AVSTETPAPTPSETQPPTTVTATVTTAPSPTTGSPPTATPTSGPANWGSGIVSNTQGAGVNCRNNPSLSAGVIIVLAEGARVQLTGPASGGWQPVLCGGRQGYVSAPYLTTTQYTPTPASTATTLPVQTPASPATNQPTVAITPTTPVQSTATVAPTGTPGLPNWGIGTVSNTQGAGVNCRTSPSLSAGVVTVLPEGARVQLTGPASNGWQPVVCSGRQGYVSAPYLQAVAFTPTPVSATTPTRTPGSTTTAIATRTATIQNSATTTVAPTASATATPSLPNWGTGTVRNTGGLGVNCRTAPTTSSSVIRTLPEGTVVQLTGPASGGWQPVACNNRQGYISAQYLAAVAYTPTVAPTQATSGADALMAGETATTPSETPSVPDIASTSTATASAEPSTAPVISPTDEPTSTPPPVPTEVPPTVVLPTPDLPDPTAEILPTEPPAPTEVVVTSAWVAWTNGQGLACLAAPSWDSALLAALPDGTEVTRFGDPVDGWQAIGCADQYGYVDASYLSETPVEPDVVVTEVAATMPPEATEPPVDTPDQGPVAAEPQTFQFAPIAETSVLRTSPDVPQAGVSGDQLLLGGPDGGMVVLTFAVSGIADGTVVDATLLITGAGDGSGAGGTVLAVPGVGIDPWSATTASIDALGGSGVGWLDTISPGAQTALDVTGVVANGTVTFVLTGTEAPVAIASSASGAGPVLIVTAQPGG
ncbi:MAG: SH3 domain-containing protein, partial [Thermomicrobiales bacterium]